MICFISILLLYITLLIGLKFNLFSEYFAKWDNLGLIKKVYCEGSSGDGGSNNFNSKLKSPDEGKISPSASDRTRYNFSNASNNIVAGDNSTISNVNINPGQSSAERTPHVKSTISKKEVITTTVLSNLKNPTIKTQTVTREEIHTVYGDSSNNSSNSSLSYYSKQAVGMFEKPLKGHSANNSLRLTGTPTLKDSPFLSEGSVHRSSLATLLRSAYPAPLGRVLRRSLPLWGGEAGGAEQGFYLI